MWGHDFKKLIAWEKAMDLTHEVYKLVKKLPNYETYALSDQMRRAVVSIPSNIAEGYGRGSSKDRAHFLSVSLGSLYEVETQILICIRELYFTEEDASLSFELIQQTSKLINALIHRERNLKI